MTELAFSLIGEPTPTLSRLLDAFQKQHNVNIRLVKMTWDNAWPELLTYALYGKGPDVSHVGSTWASSLIGMNALRPFNRIEVKSTGGPEVFLPQAWQSVVMPDLPEIWAIPWTTYTFVICYRRDLFQKAGVDEDAFASGSALDRTLRSLQAAGVRTPWVVPVDPAHVDTLHFVASWVWGAGREFVDTAGRHILFAQPDSLRGIEAYYALLRYLDPETWRLDGDGAEACFTSGKAAATIVGADRPYAWLTNRTAVPEVLDNLGVAVMPGVPWIGGDNLVIWRHTQGLLDVERSAIGLVNFLVSRATQTTYCQGEEVYLPTRADALLDLPMPGSSLTQVVVKSLQTGRSYPAIPMWSKIEHQTSMILGQIGLDILDGTPVETAVRRHLEPLAHRLEAALGR